MPDNTPAPYSSGGPLEESAAAGAPMPADPFAHLMPMGEEEKGLNLQRYLGAILRYKWLVLAVVILGTAGGVLFARRVKPTYLTQSTIWIEQSGGPRADFQGGPIRPAELLQSTGWVDLLRSYVVLDPVVTEQKLYLDYGAPGDSALFARFELKDQFRPGDYTLEVADDGRGYELKADRGLVVQRGALGDSIGAPAGFVWLPPVERLRPGRKVEFSVLTPRDASVALGNDLETRLPQEGASFLRLSLAGTNPTRIAATLNALTSRYVEVATDLKRAKLDELTAILEEQLRYAEANLNDADNALESFRVQTITLPSEPSTPVTPGLEQTRDPVFSRYFDMKIENEDIRRDREAIASALAAQERTGETPVERLWAVGAVQSSAELKQALNQLTDKQAELRGLLTKYTDDYVEVKQLRNEIQTLQGVSIPRLARTLDAQLAQRQDVLQTTIGEASSELKQVPPRMIEEARLRRRESIAENFYTNIQSRYENARLAAVSSIPDIRVLDRATVPSQPTNPAAGQRAIIMAFLGSLGLALGGAILAGHFDRRIRFPDQITDDIGLPILGTVPVAAPAGKEDPDQTAQVVESFRELRLSLMHAYGAAGPVVVTLSSPGSGDGKSFVTSNLALAFADMGYRTLVIDGDIRRGTMHNALGGSRKPGLTDFLAGAVPASGLIQRTSYPNVDFIGSGTWRRSGPELLGSSSMRQLIADMRSRYRVILVDSSPLGAGVDPYVLGTITGNLMLVLRLGATDGELASAKLDVIGRLPIRVLGAVMNAVPARGAYRYYSYFSDYQLGPVDEVDDADEAPHEPAAAGA